jgi:TM2 domain
LSIRFGVSSELGSLPRNVRLCVARLRAVGLPRNLRGPRAYLVEPHVASRAPLTRRPSKRPFTGRPASHALLSLRQRFYVGRPASGIVWLLTGGLFGIGWLIDFFLIPDFV